MQRDGIVELAAAVREVAQAVRKDDKAQGWGRMMVVCMHQMMGTLEEIRNELANLRKAPVFKQTRTRIPTGAEYEAVARGEGTGKIMTGVREMSERHAADRDARLVDDWAYPPTPSPATEKMPGEED